jgi:hypothetical protein
MILSTQRVHDYNEKGYLFFKQHLFNSEELGRLTEIFEERLEAKGDKLSDELATPCCILVSI